MWYMIELNENFLKELLEMRTRNNSNIVYRTGPFSLTKKTSTRRYPKSNVKWPNEKAWNGDGSPTPTWTSWPSRSYWSTPGTWSSTTSSTSQLPVWLPTWPASQLYSDRLSWPITYPGTTTLRYQLWPAPYSATSQALPWCYPTKITKVQSILNLKSIQISNMTSLLRTETTPVHPWWCSTVSWVLTRRQKSSPSLPTSEPAIGSETGRFLKTVSV